MDISEIIDRLSDEFEQRWRAGGERPQIEQFCRQVEPAHQAALVRELLLVEFQLRQEVGETFSVQEYRDRLSGLSDEFWEQLDDWILRAGAAATTVAIKGPVDTEPETVPDQTPGGPTAAPPPPPDLGRYRIRALLGRGAFGAVYLSDDEVLQRLVAVKVPHPHIENSEDYVAEARVLASLDHPGIVPVYDVGQTADGRRFVVSKYIEGEPLSRRLQMQRPTFAETARIVSQVAEALHYAHTHGLFHRDIKPANILIDLSGAPFVVDFGMALKFEHRGQNCGLAGTPPYMSPEQARGDSDLLDGRSDIFSLGIVLYEMLTGDRPFHGKLNDLLRRIIEQEARPPRSIDDRIPRELERICLQALSKHMADRFTTALDMAHALQNCVTYTPTPIPVEGIELPDSLQDLSELLSQNNHDIWAEQRIKEGWQYGDVRDDLQKTHPDLVPYEQLTEGEKEYDRRTVIHSLKAILSLGYEIRRKEE